MTYINDTQGVIFDTDFLIALFIADQTTHAQASGIFHRIKNHPPFILNLVKYEFATVLSHKFSYTLAKELMTALNRLPINYLTLTEADEQKTWKEFFSHEQKAVSFVDCANLIMARKLGILIASFDSFYPNEISVRENID